VKAVQGGITQAKAAKLFGVSRYSVIKWVAAYRAGGESALAVRRRGRRKGQGAALTAVGKYLRSWGGTPQRPVLRAYEKISAAFERWPNGAYPAIQAKAKAEGKDGWGVRSYLRSTQKQPSLIHNYFNKEHVCYAA
jgi:molybdenum-dependent DNA-binding transcriptional regulator ModE